MSAGPHLDPGTYRETEQASGSDSGHEILCCMAESAPDQEWGNGSVECGKRLRGWLILKGAEMPASVQVNDVACNGLQFAMARHLGQDHLQRAQGVDEVHSELWRCNHGEAWSCVEQATHHQGHLALLAPASARAVDRYLFEWGQRIVRLCLWV